MSDAAATVKATEEVFAALAHGSRRHILLTLQFRGGEMSAGEIAERFGCSWPTTTRHLNVLREAGLISVEKRGRERVYTLQQERLRAVVGDWLTWFTPQGRSLATAHPRGALARGLAQTNYTTTRGTTQGQDLRLSQPRG